MPNAVRRMRGLATLVFAAVATSTAADPVPLVNPGFETVSRALVPGEQTNGIGGAGVQVGTMFPFPFGAGVVDWTDPVIVPGWQSPTLPFGDPRQVLAGVLHPTEVDGQPFITGVDGEYVLAIQAAQAGQRTSAVLQPDTEYTLSFLGGISRFDSDYFFAVSLIAIDDTATLPIEGRAGVTRLEIGRFFPPTGPEGIIRRYEFSYITPATLPPALVGTHVGINVYGSDGIPRVLYDDFALTATSLSCVADLDGDGELTIFDFLEFQSLFDLMDPTSDFDGDGEFTIFDFLAFQNAFDAEC